MYVAYQQENWSQWLPLANFAYNNSTHSYTKQFPFQTLYGRKPTFSSLHVAPSQPATNYLEQIQYLQLQLQTNLEEANQRFKEQEDQFCTTAPTFAVGD